MRQVGMSLEEIFLTLTRDMPAAPEPDDGVSEPLREDEFLEVESGEDEL
jgi:hypothetical protein